MPAGNPPMVSTIPEPVAQDIRVVDRGRRSGASNINTRRGTIAHEAMINRTGSAVDRDNPAAGCARNAAVGQGGASRGGGFCTSSSSSGLDLDGGVAVPDIESVRLVLNIHVTEMEGSLTDPNSGFVVFAGAQDQSGRTG